MMRLLAPRPPAELPAEALLARLRSRRSTLDVAGRGAPFTGLSPEQGLQKELEWVYLRLDARLRRQLQPYFEIQALRLVTHALRHALVGESPPVRLVQAELLDPELQKTLGEETDPLHLVTSLELGLTGDCPFVAGLTQVFLQQGPGGVELHLNRGMLESGLSAARGTVYWVIRAMIDMRNLLGILKYWRWQAGLAPPLVPGGQLPVEKLVRLWQSRDSTQLQRLASVLAQRPVMTGEPHQVEKALFEGIGRQLRRARRNPLSVAVVVDYLWSCQLVAHNQLLRQTAGDEPPELLTEALLS